MHPSTQLPTKGLSAVPAVTVAPPHDTSPAPAVRASQIALGLLEAARPCGAGSITWLDPDTAKGAAPRPLAPHVYDGTAGIALYLAAAAAYGQGNVAGALREGALAAISPIRCKLLDLAEDPSRGRGARMAIGGFAGLGSIVYALTRIGRDLGEPELVADASRIAGLLRAERIRRDDQFDVVAGTAGALLAVLALHEALTAETDLGPEAGFGRQADRLLDVARCCGEHLLESRVRWRGLPRAWPGPNRPPLTGFAHGAAGIAHALLRLDERRGESRYRAAAREAFDFERALFLPEAGNWLDPRRDRPLEQTAWCYGPPGMALSRLKALRTLGDAAVRDDFEKALELSVALPEKLLDYLCCGNAGQVDVLLTCAAATERPELASYAHDLVRRVEDRGERFEWLEEENTARPAADSPSLFLGWAGWGWALLQTAHGGTLPSLFAME